MEEAREKVKHRQMEEESREREREGKREAGRERVKPERENGEDRKRRCAGASQAELGQ